jgi:hypothetical protein
MKNHVDSGAEDLDSRRAAHKFLIARPPEAPEK